MSEHRQNPSQRELRWFGLLLLAFFTLVAAILVWRFAARGIATAVLATGTTLAALYYVVRPLRLPIYRGWRWLFRPLAWVVLRLSFAVVYFLVLTPVGVVSRALGVDHLDLEVDPEASSYWVEHGSPTEASSYFKQF